MVDLGYRPEMDRHLAVIRGPYGLLISDGEVRIPLTFHHVEWTVDPELAAQPTAGRLTLSNLVVSGNVAGRNGGGISLSRWSPTTIENCTISGNDSGTVEPGLGGGIRIDAPYWNFDPEDRPDIVVRNSTISANTSTSDGGGIGITGATGAKVWVVNSTVAANAAPHGAGMSINGAPNLLQVTISGNRASIDAGGLEIVEMSGWVQGTIVSGNLAGAVESNDIGSWRSTFKQMQAHESLIGAVQNIDLTGTNILRSTDPGLAPLADNGGATATMMLLSGSPAIGAGPETPFDFPGSLYDQRGPGFPRSVGGRIDIGAVEAPAPQPPPDPDPVRPSFTG